MLGLIRSLRTTGETPKRLPPDTGQAGGIRPGVILIALVLGVAVHVGLQAAPGYVNQWYLRDAVRGALRDVAFAPERADEAKQKILAKARELEIPVTARQVVLTVDIDKVHAYITWQQQIGLFAITIPLAFEIEESVSLR